MRIGAHVGTSGGIHTAIDRGVELGCESIQVFTTSPRAWKAQQHPPENLARFRELRAEHDLPVVCHASYLINLAGTDEAVVEKSGIALAACCEVAAQLAAEAVIVHVGSHLGDGFEAGLDRIEGELGRVLEGLPDDLWLLLENTAGAGGTIGRTVDELAAVIERCPHPRLGVCLDSCHLFASGIAIGDPAEMTAFVDRFDAAIGLDRLRSLHLNDSQMPFDSNRDRHANVGEGLIGEGLAAFLGHPRLQDLPCVLETPGHDGKGVDEQCLASARRLHQAGIALY
ncbi:MAG TPA: deoxyribonuclease IV [Gaiellales bacterium]|jgi:deoxyribonuclease-4